MKGLKESQALLLIAVFALLCVIAAPLCGQRIPPLDALLHPFSGDPEASILWELRVPRVLAGGLRPVTLRRVQSERETQLILVLGVLVQAELILATQPLADPLAWSLQAGISQ